jgi:hypothetical protein
LLKLTEDISEGGIGGTRDFKIGIHWLIGHETIAFIVA